MPVALFPEVPRDRPWVEFFRSPAELQPYISGFNVYGTFGARPGSHEHFFPGWATARFNYSDAPWRVTFRGKRRTAVPETVLFGPSSSDIDLIIVEGGISLGFGITPLGLVRLLRRPAISFADSMHDLGALWPDAADMRQRLGLFASLQEAFDWLAGSLAAKMGPPHPDEPIIVDLMALLVDQHDISVTQVCRELGYSERVLRRVAQQHFGFPIKFLLRRSRFLKSLLAIYGTAPGDWAVKLDSGYHDQSHFIRDSHDFLGMSPRHFLRQKRPMTDLSIARRREMLGASFLALHAPSLKAEVS